MGILYTYSLFIILVVIILALRLTKTPKNKNKISKNQLSAKQLEYRDYLNTEHWKEVRKIALKRSGYKCQLCGFKKYLNVHHNTYKNKGHENPEDLIVLCNKCHNKFHDK